ncbi:MAG: hypothetical protein MZW92_19715 [Comamonadaceae bacterium]|nr:hypothetical protein [Comamonadaceae bacterium]
MKSSSRPPPSASPTPATACPPAPPPGPPGHRIGGLRGARRRRWPAEAADGRRLPRLGPRPGGCRSR